jgi:energy-coupling factor transporter ATP-binding protein EcfA2
VDGAPLLVARDGTVDVGGRRRLGPVAVTVAPGERLLLSGPSGSGKTTMLRMLSGAAGRAGATVGGRVEVAGRDPADLRPAERPGLLGAVPQRPDDALVGGTVGDELSFAPRCAGLAVDLAAAAARVGLRVPLDADPRATSTGERQRLVVGAALACRAQVLLLDEPLAHLDPAGADALLATLAALADAGTAVVVAEHRLGRVRPWASREVSLEAGRIVRDGPPLPPDPPAPPAPWTPPGEVVVSVRGLTLPRGLPPLTLEVRGTERVALVGPNGAGKTTLLDALAERLGRRAVWIPADPDLTLTAPDVRSELAFGARPGGPEVARVARALRIDHLLERPPHAASRGERLRVAVGAALCAGPEVLLLDEPTAGQDPDAVEALFAALRELGAAVVFATHDLAVAARHAHRTIEVGR